MAFKRNGANRPVIESISPGAALPGGDVQIRGREFIRSPRPEVMIGGALASLVVASDRYVVARVPESAEGGALTLDNGEAASEAQEVAVGYQLMDSLHPVASPAVDAAGTIYTTFSDLAGRRRLSRSTGSLPTGQPRRFSPMS